MAARTLPLLLNGDWRQQKLVVYACDDFAGWCVSWVLIACTFVRDVPMRIRNAGFQFLLCIIIATKKTGHDIKRNLGNHLLADRPGLVSYTTDMIWQAGCFGEMVSSSPAQSRWGTVRKAAAANVLSKLVHGVGVRVWRGAFLDVMSEPTITLSLDQDDFHKVLRSKIQRTVRNAGDIKKAFHHCCVSFISAPCDHLMQVLQKQADVGMLMELLNADDTNPFLAMQLDLGQMVYRRDHDCYF